MRRKQQNALYKSFTQLCIFKQKRVNPVPKKQIWSTYHAIIGTLKAVNLLQNLKLRMLRVWRGDWSKESFRKGWVFYKRRIKEEWNYVQRITVINVWLVLALLAGQTGLSRN